MRESPGGNYPRRLALLVVILVACHSDGDRVQRPPQAGSRGAINRRLCAWRSELKRRVAQNWDPAGLWKRIDPTGAVYGKETRVTEVQVVLSSDGALLDIEVLRTSGVQELDDEGVRAFRAAAPFAPPAAPLPEGAVVSDGKVKFNFSFYFQAGKP